MNLKFLINILASHHYAYNFFAVTVVFLHTKLTLYFNIEHSGLCLQVLCMLLNIHFCPPYPDDAITGKNELSFVKNILPSGDKIFLRVIRDVFFDEKDYLNVTLFRYPFADKWDKFSHIMSLLNYFPYRISGYINLILAKSLFSQ